MDKCPECGSDEVYEDIQARSKSEGRLRTVTMKWYDCLACGCRLLEKEVEREPEMEQVDTGGNRLSDFEWGTEKY